MKIAIEYRATNSGDEDYPFEHGRIYNLFQCLTCQNIELDGCDFDESETSPIDSGRRNTETLYPIQPNMPQGLPKRIKEEYSEALQCRNGNASAYGVMLGRVLDLVCKDKKAKGNMLGNQINDLKSKGLIPAQLADVAFGLKDLRNVGAHASIGKLTSAQIPVLENLTRAILEYVYSGPQYIKDAQAALKKVGKRKKAKLSASQIVQNIKVTS